MTVSIFATAKEAARGANLKGYVAIVTGGSSGIGLNTVDALVSCGATVYLCSRSMEKGEKCADVIRNKGYPGTVHVLSLDLMDLASVHAFTQEFKKREKVIHMLVLNAGLTSMEKKYTKQGFEMQWGVNHFSQVALVQDLIDTMVMQKQRARIVFVSSDAYIGGYGFTMDDVSFKKNMYFGMKVYSDTKLANLLTAKELAQKLQKTQIKVFAVHPGAVRTNFFANIPIAGTLMNYVPGWVDFLLNRLSFSEYKSAPQGAASVVYAAIAPELEDHSGAYIRNCRIANPLWFAKDMKKANMVWTKTVELLKEAENQK